MRTSPHWAKIGLRPHHGICVPLFSLRTEKSCGIGEFTDLIPLINWCKSLKLDCIQLLPLDDTGTDPSPYNPLTSCALDPVYLGLSHLPDPGKDLLLELDLFTPLTRSQRVHRNEVKKMKLEWLKKYFAKAFKDISQTTDYKGFIEKNGWLELYGLFLALKGEFGGKHWRDWPEKYAHPEPQQIELRQGAVDFHSFVQFLCHSQLRKAKEHASKNGVFIKGDIPILISQDSVDVWSNRSLFNLDYAAGAPPDYYNPDGQNWGFPLFDWEQMRHRAFTWWKRRLAVAEPFFHIYRIDHVVGFFRIWGIPQKKELDGAHFIPSERDLWAGLGIELLNMLIECSPLLPIAEDLGTIPEEVYPILKQLGICGTKVVRWERYKGGDRDYIPYSKYEPFSMTTLSTPDIDPLGTWWKKFPAESVPFAKFKNWEYHSELATKQRLELLRDAHHTPSYFHINLLQEYLALFPELVWLNPEDERINVPGTTLPTNWTYRFRPFLEEIAEHKGLADALQQIL